VTDSGAGTAIALGVIAAIMALTIVMIGVGNGVVKQARLNALADAAALAAADALRGLVAGYPCDVAKHLAPISKCLVLGGDVLVQVRSEGQTAEARAGEPN